MMPSPVDIPWILAGLGAAIVTFAVPALAIGYIAGRSDAPDGQRAKRLVVRAFLVLVVLGGAASLYLRLKFAGVGDSALVFTGLPALLGIGLALAVDFRSPMRTVFAGVTAFLCLSIIWLGPGIICALVAAPLLYLVAWGTLLLTRQWYRRGKGLNLPAVVMIIVLLSSVEGIAPGLSLPRAQSVEVVETVALGVDEVRANLAAHPDLERLPLAPVLKLGFPMPVAAIGEGLDPGDVRRFEFARLDGTVEAVAFKVASAFDGGVALEPLYDETQIATWLGWRGTEIRWRATGTDTSEVRVTMRWERRLDPAWYFAPVQRFVVARAARVLIAHAAQSATLAAHSTATPGAAVTAR